MEPIRDGCNNQEVAFIAGEHAVAKGAHLLSKTYPQRGCATLCITGAHCVETVVWRGLQGRD